ncbi:Lon family ATP-dependent protease [Metallumcola ferriviriculae]|uniref:endopeptidase La n=1 Tax=Metallumcola ferriviriculae TaxID=3039180 RepID=A0AAU0UK86_9FIRM|nr:Lon family ATP-dependent protease [Desulfitibacteraceae bacterium MK1]
MARSNDGIDDMHLGTSSDKRRSEVEKRIAAIYAILGDLWGKDKLVMRASKLEALQEMRSKDVSQRIIALVKLVDNNPALDIQPEEEDYGQVLDRVEEKIAEQMARRSVEEQLEENISQRMQQRQEEYLKEIKMQILKEKTDPENAKTLKKLAELEKMDTIGLARSAQEILRPGCFEEIIGQELAIQALISKIASPFPQHIIIYGPPGVGKTSAARLALEQAKRISGTPFAEGAPFTEVDGTTLRWDPRDVTNPLMGSVHDPIYQGARRDLADTGIPEPKLGLVSHSHGGVLFIDEILEMDPVLLNKLLKVLEDKKVEFESSYYDPDDESVPQYIKKIFEEGAPADFVLIGATTRSPQDLHPALRSRCAEVFFEPLTPGDIRIIVEKAAEKLEVDMDPSVPEVISEYTVEGRKANSILVDAYGLALYQRQKNAKANAPILITPDIIYSVIQSARLTPYANVYAGEGREVGKILGMGVNGFIGSVLEIESVSFPAGQKGKGKVRFNDTAGSMAKDSVFNAASVIRKVTGRDVYDYDMHINVVGGGNIDGPSAGAAIFLAMYSALEEKPLRQDIGVTGELSIQGSVKPVGGIAEKIYGAKQAGVSMVIIPGKNKNDVPAGIKGIEIVPVDHVRELLELVL